MVKGEVGAQGITGSGGPEVLKEHKVHKVQVGNTGAQGTVAPRNTRY